jgi:hypothetical protein
MMGGKFRRRLNLSDRSIQYFQGQLIGPPDKIPPVGR